MHGRSGGRRTLRNSLCALRQALLHEPVYRSTLPERSAGFEISRRPRESKGDRPAGGVVRWCASPASVCLLKFRVVQRKRQRRLQLRRLDAARAKIRIRARPPHHPCMTSYAARSDRAVPRPDHPQVR